MSPHSRRFRDNITTETLRITFSLSVRLFSVLLPVCVTPPLVRAQSQPAPVPAVAFEVASVKPNPLPTGHFVIRKYPNGPLPRAEGNRYTQRRITLQDLVMQAYGVNDYQISGLPAWAKAPGGDHFDVEAKAEGQETPATERLQQMLQSLLSDRFRLSLHKEMKELSVYTLAIGKSGAKIRELREDEPIPTYSTRPPEMATFNGTFDGIVSLVRTYADRPVMNETGITGRYEFTSPPPELGLARRSDPLAAEGMLFEWVQELGLKLEPQKKPTDILVIDRVEKPSPN
jgi:uncharacterized protein (TIGR03435 family)